MNGVTALMVKHVNVVSWKCIEIFSPCFTLSSVWKARKFSCNFYFDCFITITYISVTTFIIINNKFCVVGLAKINVSFFFFPTIYCLLMSAKTSLMQFESGHFWNNMQVVLVSCHCALLPLANFHPFIIHSHSFLV